MLLIEAMHEVVIEQQLEVAKTRKPLVTVPG
jgi:hypothetical protein